MASQSEVYSLAKSVGLSDSSAKIAAAVAMAESGGDPSKHNTRPPDDSYGLWQINMLGAKGPERRKKYHLSSNEQLFDPRTNALVMAGESAGGLNWFPWSTYNNGEYKKYLTNPVTDQHLPAAPSIGSGVVSSVTAPVQGAVDTLNKTAKWVSNSENWLRVGYVTGGAVLVVAGLVMVLQSTGAGRAVGGIAKTVGSATPPGRVATVAKAGKTSRPGRASYDPKPGGAANVKRPK